MPAQSTKKTARSSVVATTKREAHQPRNFLATFLLTAIFAPLGLRHFYLGDMKLGWIRVALFGGGILWMIMFSSLQIFSLTLVGWLAFTVAVVWGAVDFFYVYLTVRHDFDGKPLVATARDKSFTAVIFWAMIGLAALSLIVGIIGLSIGESSFRTWRNELQTPSSEQQPANNWNGYY